MALDSTNVRGRAQLVHQLAGQRYPHLEVHVDFDTDTLMFQYGPNAVTFGGPLAIKHALHFLSTGAESFSCGT
jgi:hypothetical protein